MIEGPFARLAGFDEFRYSTLFECLLSRR